MPLALSPNTVWHTSVAGTDPSAGTARGAAAGAGTTSATLPSNHWFFLVTANGLPSPGADGITPNPTSPPYVMTINGACPSGAPCPNGGTTVGTAIMADPTSSGGDPAAGVAGIGSQLWKAVAAPNGNIYLRSAVSFQVNQAATTSGNPGSLLTGFAPYPVALDLGYITSAQNGASGDTYGAPYPAIYMNATGLPWSSDLADNGFQQWTYDQTGDAQISNALGGQLYNVSGESSVELGEGTSAPGNQWFPFPSYFLETVIAQPDSHPPFPAPSITTNSFGTTDVPGQQAAYNYISYAILGAAAAGETCDLVGTAYTGIRCQYANTAPGNTNLTTCQDSTSILDPPVNPETWSIDPTCNPDVDACDDTPISAADWYATYTQIHLECQYAAEVQGVFSSFNTLMTTLFLEDTELIPTLATDVGIPNPTTSDTKVHGAAIELVDGLVYTVLSGVGGTVGGVIANLMNTAVTVGLSVENQNQTEKDQFTGQFVTTVGDLYSTLGTNMQAAFTGLSLAETAILQNWGRLQQVGPLAEISGYNGLYLTPSQQNQAETAALQGYSVAIMQMLLSDAVSDFIQGTPTLRTKPAYNESQFRTFGTLAPDEFATKLSAYQIPGGQVKTLTPTSQQVIDDILGNGANPFEFFNAINGWSRVPFYLAGAYPYTDSPTTGQSVGESSCFWALGTIFNATPTNLQVVISSNGTLWAPGSSGYTAELRAYGYTPFYALAVEDSIDVSVEIVDADGTKAGAFSLAQSISCKDGDVVSDVSNGGGYWFDPQNFGLSTVSTSLDGPTPGGVWATIENSNLVPCGVNCP